MHPQIFSAVVMRKSVDMRRFTHTQLWVAAAGLFAVTGCAPQFQTQIVGRTTAVAAPPGASSSSSAIAAEMPVPESPNAQVLRYVVTLPRAVQLRYQIACPTAEREGTLGETFETYRTRRLAELERERRAEANLIGAVVGAVAPPVRAGAAVTGPGGSAAVTGEINPGAAAAEAAHASLPAASLPPGDTGAAVVRGRVELGASPAGRCALTLTADPPLQDVSGAEVHLELVRLVDVEADERARLAAIRAEQDRRALVLRVWLLGSLQRQGADPMARVRARAAAQARAEEENRRRQAAADDENRRRQAATDDENRRRQAAADEENRRRQAAQSRADQDRWQREQARLAQENAARTQVEREAAERRAQQWRTQQAAFAVRWQILARLQRLGADPLARERARAAALARADEDNQRRQAAEQERLRREREAAAERERREAPERERRANAERERLAREEAERVAKVEAERKVWLASEEARLKLEFEARTKTGREADERRARAEREATERRAREWRARQAAVALRWQLLARLQRQGADPAPPAEAGGSAPGGPPGGATPPLRGEGAARAGDRGRATHGDRSSAEHARASQIDGRGSGLPAPPRRGDVPRDGRGGAPHADRAHGGGRAGALGDAGGARPARAHQAAPAPGRRRRPPVLPAPARGDAAARAVRGRDVDRRALRLERHRLDLVVRPLRASARDGRGLGPAAEHLGQRHAGHPPRPLGPRHGRAAAADPTALTPDLSP